MVTYLITNLETNESYEREVFSRLHPVHLLPVPYFSQLGIGADQNRNDCGAASGLMVLKAYKPNVQLTVDDFYRLANPNGRDDPLWVGQIRNALKAHGLTTEYKHSLTEAMVFNLLLQKRPVIALVHYGTLVDNNLTQFRNFRTGHFVVLIGMDTNYIYAHDPYSTERRGEAMVYPINVFWQAWRDAVKDQNPFCAGFYPTVPLGEPLPGQDNALYRVRITCNAQRVRSGPGVNYDPPVRLVYRNTILPVYEEQNGWGRVGTGEWIYLGPPYNEVINNQSPTDQNQTDTGNLVSSPESPPSSEVTPPPDSSSAGGSPLYRIQITCNAQRVRSGPGVQYPSFKLVYRNTALPVYEERDNWGRIGDGEWVYLGPPYNTRL